MYITRVELHHADWTADYNRLHQEMENRGFSKEIFGDDGYTYHLPTAEYFISTELPIQNVTTLARDAANATGRTNIVLTSLASSIRWYNLTRV